MYISFGNFEISRDEHGIHLVVDNVTHLMSDEVLHGPMHALISTEDALKVSAALGLAAQLAQAAPLKNPVPPALPPSARAAIDAALAAARAAKAGRA